MKCIHLKIELILLPTVSMALLLVPLQFNKIGGKIIAYVKIKSYILKPIKEQLLPKVDIFPIKRTASMFIVHPQTFSSISSRIILVE